jgi:hypothetical protein
MLCENVSALLPAPSLPFARSLGGWIGKHEGRVVILRERRRGRRVCRRWSRHCCLKELAAARGRQSSQVGVAGATTCAGMGQACGVTVAQLMSVKYGSRPERRLRASADESSFGRRPPCWPTSPPPTCGTRTTRGKHPLAQSRPLFSSETQRARRGPIWTALAWKTGGGLGKRKRRARCKPRLAKQSY